jgi:hypothetical protein
MLSHRVEELSDRALLRELGANLIADLRLVVLAGVGGCYNLENGVLRLPARICKLERIGDRAGFCAGLSAGVRRRQ